MKAKEFLRQYQQAKYDLEIAMATLKELEEMEDNISIGEGEGIRTNNISDKTGNLAVKIADKKAEIARGNNELYDILSEVKAVIDLVEKRKYKRLLHLRYIEGLRWEQVAKELNYDTRWTLKLHGQALLIVDGILKDIKRH